MTAEGSDTKQELHTYKPMPVLNDDLFTTEDALGITDGIAAEIKVKKKTQEILQYLNRNYPLSNMTHVKRVRSSKGQGSLQILLLVRNESCQKFDDLFKKLSNCEDAITLSDIDQDLDKFRECLGSLFSCKVPSKNPLTRPQFELGKKYWPVSFHEDKKLTQFIKGDIFKEFEFKFIEGFFRVVDDIVKVGCSKGLVTPSAAVVVDPQNNEIIASSHDMQNIANDYFETGYCFKHPLQHAAMVAIDLVARAQGGGSLSYPANDKPEKGLYWNRDLQERSRSRPTSSEQNSGDEKHKNEFYICTGYDIYLNREPCIMCAMALLHSRIRRVFYREFEPVAGALGSRYKLHCMKELNHHFDVFQCVQQK